MLIPAVLILLQRRVALLVVVLLHLLELVAMVAARISQAAKAIRDRMDKAQVLVVVVAGQPEQLQAPLAPPAAMVLMAWLKFSIGCKR